MASRNVQVRRGPAKAPSVGGFQYVLDEGQTEEQYRKLIDSTNKSFGEAEKDFKTFNAKRLVMMWATGDQWQSFFSLGKTSRGRITESQLKAVVADLAPFSTGQKVTKEILRMCLSVREKYPKDRIEELTKSGINENHVSVFLQLEDPKARKQLEEKAIKEGLNGDQCRKVVRELAKDPSKAGVLKGTTKARYAQEESRKSAKRKQRTDNPAKMISYFLGKAEADSDDLADLYASLQKVEKLEPADQSALSTDLGTLKDRLTEIISTLTAIRDSATTAMATAKAALAKEGKTQGVKGAEATPAAKAAVVADKKVTTPKTKPVKRG